MYDRRCLDDHDGRPLCGAPPEGAFLVDQPIDVTCPACLVLVGRRLDTCPGDHAGIVAGRLTGDPIGVHVDEHGQPELEQVNCPVCHTTMSRPIHDQVLLASLRELAGAPPEGWPFLELPSSGTVRLERDSEIDGMALGRLLEAGGALDPNGYRFIARSPVPIRAAAEAVRLSACRDDEVA